MCQTIIHCLTEIDDCLSKVNNLMCIFGFWEENEKWINFKNKTENLKALSKYKTEKTEHSVLTDEICLSERHEENKRRC